MKKSKYLSFLTNELAKTALRIGAIELRPEEPFQWASGTFNPIYNDNRMLMGEFQNFKIVIEGIREIIRNNELSFDILCGTSLSGIAPAAGVHCASAIIGQCPWHLIILHEEKLFQAKYDGIFEGTEATAIIGTAPWAIPIGISSAIIGQKGFMYLRPEVKKHGKQKLIEGSPKPGQIVQLITVDENLSHDSIYENIADAKLELYHHTRRKLRDEWKLLPNLTGKKVLVIEDLISTGGSTLKEVRACRKAGAEVLGVISIFNYGFESAKKAFEEENCPVYSILDYDTLLEVAKEEKMFSDEQLAILAEWKKDQPNWGTKHGHPPVEKKS